MKEDFDELDDDQLYASFEAYKALLDAGLSKKEAIERTGLTPQIVKDLEAEEDELELKADFKEVWDEDGDEVDGAWDEDNLDEEAEWGDSGDFDEGGYDDRDF
jgi:hypothetical protein